MGWEYLPTPTSPLFHGGVCTSNLANPMDYTLNGTRQIQCANDDMLSMHTHPTKWVRIAFFPERICWVFGTWRIWGDDYHDDYDDWLIVIMMMITQIAYNYQSRINNHEDDNFQILHSCHLHLKWISRITSLPFEDFPSKKTHREIPPFEDPSPITHPRFPTLRFPGSIPQGSPSVTSIRA